MVTAGGCQDSQCTVRALLLGHLQFLCLGLEGAQAPHPEFTPRKMKDPVFNVFPWGPFHPFSCPPPSPYSHSDRKDYTTTRNLLKITKTENLGIILSPASGLY